MRGNGKPGPYWREDSRYIDLCEGRSLEEHIADLLARAEGLTNPRLTTPGYHNWYLTGWVEMDDAQKARAIRNQKTAKLRRARQLEKQREKDLMTARHLLEKHGLTELPLQLEVDQ